MRQMFDEKLDRFDELERQMADPAVSTNSSRMAAAAREHGTLAKLATKYRRFKQLVNEIRETKEMLEGDDEELKQLAEEALPELKQHREKLWQELLDMTVGGEDANRLRSVMEIRAGTGGDEASLFAGDLFRMYKKHCETRGWKVEILEASPTELGGFKTVVLAIQGEGAYRELQYESGGHRVQRVPTTEAKGRIHTSAATVAVLPEPEDVEVNLKPDDYRVDKYCASGPGGQHVNKTESAIRLTHYETNICVEMQDERSQHKNMAKALRILKTRLYEHFRKLEHDKRAAERKTLIGSGDRSERIRTYNFPENRVTDHRIGFTLYKLDHVINGNLQPVTDALIEYDRAQLRDEMGGLD